MFHCSTIYTVILSTLLLLHHWYCYCHCIVPVIEITWILIVLNNNIIDNVHRDWGIDGGDNVCILGGPRNRLHSRIRFHCRVPGDDWHPVLFILSLTHYYCYWLPSGRTWFSARWLGRGSGYVRNPPKVWTISSIDQFQ